MTASAWIFVLCSGCVAACGRPTNVIAIDGSSTVYPINEAVAEAFKGQGARVSVGVSGTGGGFKKLCNGEIAVSGASRPIKPSEVEQCRSAGVEYVELPVAYDGLAVLVHPANDWVDHLTVAELRRIWAPEAQGEITTWADVRPDWPKHELHLFGPGVDSGTYDYFTKAIVGTEHAGRGDFTSSEDDNMLVQGVSSDKFALGFFGYTYYAENAERLGLVPIDDGKPDNGRGPIAPSRTSVADGTYQPLSRPVFVYVSANAAKRPEVAQFIDFYLSHAPELVREVGYTPLPSAAYELVRARFTARTLGSAFGGRGSRVGVAVEHLLQAE